MQDHTSCKSQRSTIWHFQPIINFVCHWLLAASQPRSSVCGTAPTLAQLPGTMHVSRIVLAVLVAGVVACSVSAAADAVAGDNAPMLWPVPKSVAVSGPARSFATGFKIASTNKNANLVDAINRYNAIVQKEIAKATPLRLRHAASATSIVNVTVVVTGHDNSLGPNTDYRCAYYSCDGRVCMPNAFVCALLVPRRLPGSVLTPLPRSYLVEVAPTNSVVTIQAPSVFGAMCVTGMCAVWNSGGMTPCC